MTNEKQHYDVFLSYSHKDMAWAKEFATTLKNRGVTTWFDDDNLQPGDNWGKSIEQALRESNTLVLVLSQSNVNSPWTFFELGAAFADKKRIIPVLAEDVDISQVPLPVRKLQMLHIKSPTEAGKRVAEVIAA